jgi:hypothetical protein
VTLVGVFVALCVVAHRRGLFVTDTGTFGVTNLQTDAFVDSLLCIASTASACA